jgi:hypothetical protein
LRGREDERLLAVRGDRERGPHRDLGLAEADVAADESIHRTRRLEVLLDHLDRRLLVGGLLVGEARLQLLEQVAVDVVGDAGRPLAAGVEGEKLAGELAGARARPRLQVLPGLAAEARERGHVPVGPDVAGDLADLLVRDVEAVVSPEAEEEVVARDAGDSLRLEAEQLGDSVILVHDVVARAEVGEALERTAETDVRPRRALAEDLRVGKEDGIELAEHDSAAGGRDGEEKRRLVRQRIARLEQDGLDPPEEPLRAQRLAAVGERHDDPVPAADIAEEVAFGLREPAGGDRRALRLECVWLAGRKLGELDRAGQAEVDAQLLPDSLPGIVGLPDEIDPGKRRHEVIRHAGRLSLFAEPGPHEIEPALGGRVDGRLLESVQRPLGEGRERPQGLDLVPEELDADRLPARRGEDVDEAAPHGELPSLLGLVDPFVTGE